MSWSLDLLILPLLRFANLNTEALNDFYVLRTLVVCILKYCRHLSWTIPKVEKLFSRSGCKLNGGFSFFFKFKYSSISYNFNAAYFKPLYPNNATTKRNCNIIWVGGDISALGIIRIHAPCPRRKYLVCSCGELMRLCGTVVPNIPTVHPLTDRRINVENC
jgi:hypothetical protein